jgi:hypothetical protein
VRENKKSVQTPFHLLNDRQSNEKAKVISCIDFCTQGMKGGQKFSTHPLELLLVVFSCRTASGSFHKRRGGQRFFENPWEGRRRRRRPMRDWRRHPAAADGCVA